jgi:hypothetical protein
VFPLWAAAQVISFHVLASASESTGQAVDHDLRERLGLLGERRVPGFRERVELDVAAGHLDRDGSSSFVVHSL